MSRPPVKFIPSCDLEILAYTADRAFQSGDDANTAPRRSRGCAANRPCVEGKGTGEEPCEQTTCPYRTR